MPRKRAVHVTKVTALLPYSVDLNQAHQQQHFGYSSAHRRRIAGNPEDGPWQRAVVAQRQQDPRAEEELAEFRGNADTEYGLKRGCV